VSALPVTDLRPGHRLADAPNSGAGAEPSLTLRQIMRERLALSEEADPHALAGEIAAELPEDFVHEVALHDRFRAVAEADHRTVSQELRRLMEQRIAEADSQLAA
jgi:hypothetical protein